MDLHKAAEKGDLSALRRHLDAGVDTEGYTFDGFTPLDEAALKGHVDIVIELLNRGAKTHESALLLANMQGHALVVKELVFRGAKVDIYTNLGMTPLMISIFNERFDIFIFLLENGADVHPGSICETTPLICASKLEDVRFVRLLLDRGVDIEDKDSYGRTALMQASSYGRLAIVQELLNRGASLDTMDECGSTALSLSIEHPLIMKEFLERGASHEKLLNYARSYQSHSEVARLIESYVARQELVPLLETNEIPSDVARWIGEFVF